MKKNLFLLLGVLGVALPAGAEEHKIEMVTYFPVPYVAYSQIKPTKQLDVGTATACEMNLGCAESGDAGVLPLSVTGNMYLKKGRLDFNSAAAVYSNVVRLGNGIGAANLDFGSNLRVGSINNGYTLDADQTTVDTLDLFPGRINNSFPSCAAVGGTSSISWQKLKLNNKEETYLMCGNAKELESPCDDSKREACVSPTGAGTVRGFWDLVNCKCTCPSGTWLTLDGSCHKLGVEIKCKGKEAEMKRCTSASSNTGGFAEEIAHVAGTWDWENCTCKCPSGSAYSPSVGCVQFRVDFGGSGNMGSVVGQPGGGITPGSNEYR